MTVWGGCGIVGKARGVLWRWRWGRQLEPLGESWFVWRGEEFTHDESRQGPAMVRCEIGKLGRDLKEAAGA